MDPRRQAQAKGAGDNESPGRAQAGDGVGDALAEGRLLLDPLVRVAGGASAHELLGGMELTPQHSQHIHSSERLALQQNGYVVPADFEAERLFEGHGTALMRRLV